MAHRLIVSAIVTGSIPNSVVIQHAMYKDWFKVRNEVKYTSFPTICEDKKNLENLSKMALSLGLYSSKNIV